IAFQNELAYLSTSFGIVVYNLDKKEVKDTYFLRDGGVDLEVLEIAFKEQEIFAATSAGVYQANVNDNLFDFSKWRKHGVQQSSPQWIFTSLVNFGNNIYGLNNNAIYKFDGSVWQASSVFGVDVKKLKVSNKKLITIAPFRVIVYDENLNIIDNSQNTQAFSS